MSAQKLLQIFDKISPETAVLLERELDGAVLDKNAGEEEILKVARNVMIVMTSLCLETEISVIETLPEAVKSFVFDNK